MLLSPGSSLLETQISLSSSDHMQQMRNWQSSPCACVASSTHNSRPKVELLLYDISKGGLAGIHVLFDSSMKGPLTKSSWCRGMAAKLGPLLLGKSAEAQKDVCRGTTCQKCA